MNFFEQANAHIRDLNDNERKLFDYIIRNIDTVKEMRIRTLAEACFVSTTTIMRFTKKLGFEGYRDFIESLRLASYQVQQTKLPKVLGRESYSEEYLKNIIESVRVLPQKTVKRFKRLLEGDPHIFFYGTDLDQEVAHFAYRLFTGIGYRTSCPVENYEVQTSLNRMKDGDMLFIVSLSGEDELAIHFVEQARLCCNPVIASITNSANNTLQSLSAIDLYVFTDQIEYKNLDLTSRVSMFALTELLAYSLMKI